MSAPMIIVLLVGIAIVLVGILAFVLAIRQRGSVSESRVGKLTPAEEQRIMTYMDDGIGEIYAGLIILMFGMFLFSDMFWMGAVFVAIFIPLFSASKRTYTAPRYHQLEEKDLHPGRGTLLIGILMFAGLLGLAIGILAFLLFQVGGTPAWLDGWLTNYGWLLAGALGAGLWIIAAITTRASRFFGYALASFILLSVGIYAGLPLAIPVAAIGGIVFACGLMVLYLFVHRYPLMA